MKLTNEFDLKLAQSYFDYLVKEHNITIEEYSKSNCGWAIVETKIIKVPKITNIMSFCVAMHEIGHIVMKASKGYMKLYQSEFIAEMFALEQCKKLNFECSEYLERARRYVVMCVSKGYRRKLNLDGISEEISNFCKVDFKSWKTKKVWVYYWGGNSLDKEMKIILY